MIFIKSQLAQKKRFCKNYLILKKINNNAMTRHVV
jgi:hypothetical protein